MNKNLKYLGKILGLRVWQSYYSDGWSKNPIIVYIVETLSKLWFRNNEASNYIHHEGGFEHWEAFLKIHRECQMVVIRETKLQDDGISVVKFLETLKKYNPQMFPDFPEKCRNCRCLATRETDGFVGCLCERHVCWDGYYGKYNHHFCDCNAIVNTQHCDPEAISAFEVHSELQANYSAERKNIDVEAEKTKKQKFEEAQKIRSKFKEKFCPDNEDLDKCALIKELDLRYFRHSTHHDDAFCSTTNNVFHISFDVGYWTNQKSIESEIESVKKAFEMRGVIVKPDPRDWFAFAYGYGTCNHEYIHFNVIRVE